jgi:class 3 adenylate cyclase
LFADIKGSMELIEDLDPEEARAIIDPALQIMMEAVGRYAGYVVQSTGDGIFALFGAPVAHEDHPQRALFAAGSTWLVRADHHPGHPPRQLRQRQASGARSFAGLPLERQRQALPLDQNRCPDQT